MSTLNRLVICFGAVLFSIGAFGAVAVIAACALTKAASTQAVAAMYQEMSLCAGMGAIGAVCLAWGFTAKRPAMVGNDDGK